jgi:hypothetical protein
MNKEKYNQVIDEAYENYQKKFKELHYHTAQMGKEEFINKCKTDNEFSERWGLQIEERELSLEERMGLSREKRRHSWTWQNWSVEEMEWRMNNEWNIPTKLITLTYKDNTIESYE